MLTDKLKPGMRVRVTQTVNRREGSWSTSLTGEVLSCARHKTGSWFAHAPRGKLLLYRLQLRKDDGELATLTLDNRTRIEILGEAAAV